MALKDLFKRRKVKTGMDAPIGMGGDSDAGEPGEGGPSVFMQELAELRWSAQQEAVNQARKTMDPEAWANGQFAFEYERTLAHEHEGLRDRLSNYVGGRVRDEVRELYSLAGDVATIRDELRVVDRDLVQVTRDFNERFEEVREDPQELGRYYRLRSPTKQAAKKLVAGVFILSEFIISGYIFDQIITTDIPLLGWVFALGLMVMLVVVPHFAAQGIKSGITRYHSFDEKHYEDDGEEAPSDARRRSHQEEQDDRGFRIVASIVGILLICLILPLSSLRATEIDGGVLWFFFFLFLQLGISGYFFLREWLDFGEASDNLWKLAEAKDLLEDERSGVLADHAEAIADFHDEAEDLLFTLREAPRWDSYIVQSYLGTIHYFRHLVAVERPDLDPFVTLAKVPYLGSEDDLEHSNAYPLDPVSREHRSLEADNAFGREWWMKRMSDALVEIPESELEDNDGDDLTDASWLVTKSPSLILREFLRRYFDLDDCYKRPSILDLEAPDSYEASTSVSNITPLAPRPELHTAPVTEVPSIGEASGSDRDDRGDGG